MYSEYFFRTEDGRIYRSWRPRAERPDPDHPAQLIPGAALLSFLVKLLFLPFDLLLAALLYALVSVGTAWGEVRRGSGWGRLAALLFLWNPASLFDTAYWGQLDSLHCLLAVAAVALLGFGRWLGAGFLLAAACLMKPLAAPLVPLLVAVAAINGRGRGFLLAGVGGLLAALLIFLPFLATGRISLVFQALLSDLEIMPYASINAHSIWWLFGGWRNANTPWIGPLTPKIIGQLLFAGTYLFLLVRSRHWMRAGAVPREQFRTNLFVLAATITIAFFFLSTHMHENHLLMAVPLLFAIAGRNRPLARLAALCCLGSFLNMALHSQLVGWIPGFLGSPARVPAIYGGPVTLTWFQLVAAALNTVLLAVVAAGSLRMAAALGRSGARG
jgi:hypothetical protein